MLQSNQLQNNKADNILWANHLIYQTNKLQTSNMKNKLKPIFSKPNLVAKKTLPVSKWSNGPFSCTTSRLNLYDRLLVIIDKTIVCKFEFRTQNSEVIIGSHPLADIVLDKPKIALFHARITCKNGQYRVESLNKEYSSYLNGKKIKTHQLTELNYQDSIRIMAFQIQFKSGDKHSASNAGFDSEQVFSSEVYQSNQEQDKNKPVSTKNKVEPLITQPWSKGKTELMVTDIIDETDEVKTFRLTGITPLSFSYLPGQFVSVILNINGQEVQRSYSMSSSPSRPYTLDLTIKRVPGGLVSNWLCDHIKPGDKLLIKGPAGRFSCLDKTENKLLLIGAGSGITPLMSMTRWLFDTASSRDTKVLCSFRNHEDIIYGKELIMMTENAKSLDIAVTLTGEQHHVNNSNRFCGRIDSNMLTSFASDLDHRDVYLCGPEAFMNGVKNLLMTLNYPMERLHCESFASPQDKPNTRQCQSSPSKNKNLESHKIKNYRNMHKVTFTKSKKVVQTNGKTDLLKLAESEGIEIDYNCRTGSCAECMVKCSSGTAEMSDDCEIDDHEIEQGWIFSCCAFARSDLVINA